MLTDVIAALSTPPGRSAIALIRVSGTGAHDVAASVLPSFTVDPPRSTRLSRVVDPRTGERLDEALYVVYRGPESYTGEDMVEVSTHGGVLVPAEVLAALFAAGSRAATPGEFTRRALANGKLDLLQAEAVGDLTAATAPAQRRAALGQLDRGLSRLIGGLRERVLELEALCCYDIDFPEEDSGPIPVERIDAAIAALQHSITLLLDTAAEGERLQEGAICVIAGRPNVGKSSLFNALLGRDRAIVTDVPGTTRDAIEAHATCDGFPFRLIDTAGLRESDDQVEQAGIEVSHKYLSAADVVLLCVEAGSGLSTSERDFLTNAGAPVVVVRTKADLLSGGSPGQSYGEEAILVSAYEGTGLATLRRKLAAFAFSSLGSRGDIEPLITRERHRIALEQAHREIVAFADARAAGLDGVVAGTHLRAAVTALDDVIGVVSTEDVLARVFATFCVGK
ncbi:MAG: tRNA uridine-5-carboxymethylaminomethyl(34) synthesis GTPase MnmE [Gemmatimonadota bacterium]|nr:MAG: tRNA uridine-5-carboxymethylaminomethyl(34) synthesis GTPase MnmE [Gemmatimonadota bacterium]